MLSELEVFFTISFYYTVRTVDDGSYSSFSTYGDVYRLLYDLAFNDEHQKKLLNTHERLVKILGNDELLEMFNAKRPWKIQIFRETGSGLSRDNTLDASKEFSEYEILIDDPNDPVQVHWAVASLLLYFQMIPRTFYAVSCGKTNGLRYLLVGDLCRVFSHAYIDALKANIKPFNPDRLVWYDPAKLQAHLAAYEALIEDFKDKDRFFSREDIHHFKSMYPPREDDTPI